MPALYESVAKAINYCASLRPQRGTVAGEEGGPQWRRTSHAPEPPAAPTFLQCFRGADNRRTYKVGARLRPPKQLAVP